MCGIAGIYASSYYKHDEILNKMIEVMNHRGPDANGSWSDPKNNLSFCHTRLSILDLSPAGSQPMTSKNNNLVITFNGEIYNHMDIRSELKKEQNDIVWQGHSDTETLLAAIQHWGIEHALNMCVGMFAFALWDKKNKKLTIARDRFGEKPLYYGWIGSKHNKSFIFASELKAIKEHPDFNAIISKESLAQYLRFLYVPAPRSIYRNIYKLEPGSMLTLTKDHLFEPPDNIPKAGIKHRGVDIYQWWNIEEKIKKSSQKIILSEKEALHKTEKTLINAIQLQSIADVPLGAFLSGGIDSSLIVALMQSIRSNPVSTYTIGFEEADFDESVFAKKVAKHLGTDHNEMRVTSSMAMDVIPKLPELYDEPFADSSQIPTHLVCKAARQDVTVALSGDAGDELFAGYNRYLWGDRVWEIIKWIPMPMRQIIGKLMTSLPESSLNNIGSYLRLDQKDDGINRLSEKIYKLGDKLKTVSDVDSMYKSLVSEWANPLEVMLNDNSYKLEEPLSKLEESLLSKSIENVPSRMMLLDTITYLPDDILCKVDRAAMGCSLETRVPFLDHRVATTAWQLPNNMKIRNNKGKWILREILYKYVPRDLIERPKSGFALPISNWLRGPLRSWAEELLDEHRLLEEGYFNADVVRKVWLEHLERKKDNVHKLWSILMFQSWLDNQ